MTLLTWLLCIGGLLIIVGCALSLLLLAGGADRGDRWERRP